MRRMTVLACLALALPLSAWADGITRLTNLNGTVAISSMAGTNGMGTIGATTITSSGSELTQWDRTTAAKGRSLGTVSFSTGTLMSGSIARGAVFAGGGSFDVMGTGAWARKLTGENKKAVTLFAGSFNGPATWALTSSSKQESTYVLYGNLVGTLWTGRLVSGGTGQTITILNRGQLNQGVGHIGKGISGFGVSALMPEPGALSLATIGLFGIAAMWWRKQLA